MYGLDLLGLAAYPDVAIHNFPSGWACGVFLTEFGNVIPALDKLLATGRCPRVRIHILWKLGHAYTANDIPTTIKGCRSLLPLIAKYPNVEFRVSPWCEWDGAKSDFVACYNAIRPILPARVAIVNTPLHTANIITDLITEFHSATLYPTGAHRYDFSFDGKAAEDSDSTLYKQNFSAAETFYFWTFNFNLHMEEGDATRKCPPTAGLIDTLVYLANSRGNVLLPDKYLLKTHSENKNNGDVRVDRPVLIAPISTPNILIRATNGQVVETLKNHGPYSGTPGTWRYYPIDTNYGYQMAEKARKLQGNAVTQVVVNGKVVGTCNMAFRQGGFR